MVRTRTRVRGAVVLFGLALLAAILATLAVGDPFHLRHARWFTVGLVAATLVLLTAALYVAVPVRGLRWLIVVVGATALAGWTVVVLLAARIDEESRVVDEVADAGGDRTLVVLEGGVPALDPVFAVAVRAGSGPFAQESVVYQGQPGAPPPVELGFADDQSTVEVRTAGGCRYTSRVEAVTLAVDVVHRPRAVDAC